MDDIEAIPLDLITTDEAISVALDLDPAVSAWKAAGSPRHDANAHVGTRAQFLVTTFVDSIMAAVRDDKLKAIVWHEGERLAFPRALWNDLRVDSSVVRGKVRWLDKSAGCPVCFDRGAWAAWSALLRGVQVPSTDRTEAPGIRELPDDKLVARLARMVLNSEYKSANAAAFAIPIGEIPDRGGNENSIR
jgi:hypothetical protein